MGTTVAGQSSSTACNAKAHDRPFIIEWDATDASSFEARASNDVVFVRYEGCTLQVIDTCSSDSVRGALGSYLPVDWTSGSVEKVDIANEAELYAKLPLGAGSLGGRVKAGEKFHMEYFVSGTRHASRPYVYKGDIEKIPGCRGVTHAVYAFNLGAFALGSLSKIHGEVGGTVWGIGAGGASRSESSAEKRGGVLESCRGETAKESATCQAPIRLTLREIQDGDNPDQIAAAAPETPNALNLAGKLQANNDRERSAGEHASAAQSKLTAGDGAGCLTELDLHDRLDPRPIGLSTNVKSYTASMRAQCLMRSGKCDAGKALLRKAIQGASAPGTSADAIDAQIDGQVGMHCAGSDAQPRDQLLYAMSMLNRFAYARGDLRPIRAAYDNVKRLRTSARNDDPNQQLAKLPRVVSDIGPKALGRAGDCVAAWAAAKEASAWFSAAEGFSIDDEHVRYDFVNHTRETCLGKPQGALTAREDLLRGAAELEFARQLPSVDAATCRSTFDRVKGTVLASPSGDKVAPEMRRAADKLLEGVGICFTKAQDCTSAWKSFVEIRRWQVQGRDDAAAASRMRDAFGSNSATNACHFKPQAGLTPTERIAFLDAVLGRSDADRAGCDAAWRELGQLLASVPSTGKDDDTRSVRENGHQHAARCFVRARACDDARRVYVAGEAQRIKKDGRAVTPAQLEASFESSHRECKP
jgi:hypothetical protein